MNKIYRAIKLDVLKCRGCTKCMNRCPVEAIRLKNGKAVIYEDKCIDCGECLKTCSYGAYAAERNTIEELKKFKVNIAIPSVTMYSQFNDFVDPCIINKSIKMLGFNEVFDITYACDIVLEILKKELENVDKPAVGLFCPSVEKLIKDSYPSLTSHVLKIITPIEIAACLIRDKYSKQGYKQEDVGVFHIASCVAWKGMINGQNSDSKGKIDGIIPFSDIYSKLLKNISDVKSEGKCKVSYSGLSWAYTGGISSSLKVNEYIHVDGIKNVMQVFDDAIKGRLNDVNFIEAFACNGGCVGGTFLIENPYNARRITKKYYGKVNKTYCLDEITDKCPNEFKKTITSSGGGEILAEDFISAVKKMKYMNELINILPGTDCGLCGSPSCKAFAEDVVRGLAKLEECTMINDRSE